MGLEFLISLLLFIFNLFPERGKMKIKSRSRSRSKKGRS